ncbi:MAG: sigma-70 family RNA polymerase sigma factor [Ignavibacteria bacterium]
MRKHKDFSDLELINKIKKFDSRALEELYERYSPILFTLIKKIAPNQDTAEKVLVDVFEIIWKKAINTDFETSSVYSWIINLARNKIVDEVKRSRSAFGKSKEYNEEYENYFIIPGLSKEIDNLELATALNIKDKVENSLEKLSDTQKYVIHLAYYEGYNINEISDKLNIPVETVRNKILTSLHTLKENLISG